VNKTNCNSNFLNSSGYCDTDILIFLCINEMCWRFRAKDMSALLHKYNKWCNKAQSFNIQFGRLKIYKDKKIAIKSYNKGKAQSIDQKIEFLEDSKKDLSKPVLRCGIWTSELSEKPIFFVAMHQLGNKTNEMVTK